MDFYRALFDWGLLVKREQSTQDERQKLVNRLTNALGLIQLIGSPEVILVAHALFDEANMVNTDQGELKLAAFVFAARKHLGDTLAQLFRVGAEQAGAR